MSASVAGCGLIEGGGGRAGRLVGWPACLTLPSGVPWLAGLLVLCDSGQGAGRLTKPRPAFPHRAASGRTASVKGRTRRAGCRAVWPLAAVASGSSSRLCDRLALIATAARGPASSGGVPDHSETAAVASVVSWLPSVLPFQGVRPSRPGRRRVRFRVTVRQPTCVVIPDGGGRWCPAWGLVRGRWRAARPLCAGRGGVGWRLWAASEKGSSGGEVRSAGKAV